MWHGATSSWLFSLYSPSGVRNRCVDSPRFEQSRHNLKMCGTERHLAGESMICPGTITECFSSRSRLYNGLNSSFPPPPPHPPTHTLSVEIVCRFSLFFYLSPSQPKQPLNIINISVCLSIYLSSSSNSSNSSSSSSSSSSSNIVVLSSSSSSSNSSSNKVVVVLVVVVI